MKKKILITGANGLLGSEIVSFFKEQDWEIFAIYNRESNFIDDDVKKIK